MHSLHVPKSLYAILINSILKITRLTSESDRSMLVV